MIEVQNLAKSYRKKVAVSNLSFSVEQGMVTGFLGPNGAGKSTAMRLMLGLDTGGGTTTFDGKKLYHYSQPSKMVGILLEAKAFHPTRTARNHLRVLADASGVPSARVDEVLQEVGLHDVAKQKPGKFSLGMSQRLGIAAALLGNPKYLILDEPANGLDPEGIAWLREFLKSYADKGNGVFVSSHLLSEMALMADNVVVIGKGKLIANTSMQQLISSSSHSGVYVRTPKKAAFKELLQQQGIQTEPLDEGLKVLGLSTDDIGKLAFSNNVPLYELARQNASLEEAFLEITAGSEEFVATVKADGDRT